MAGEESEDLGLKKYEWQTVALKQTPIEKITVYKKNEVYLKGFLIYYRNGEQQVINDDGGFEAGTIVFEEHDELVGISMQCTSTGDKKPRRIGFSIMRNSTSASHANSVEIARFKPPPAGATYAIHKTKHIGNEFKHFKSFPEIDTLQGKPFAATMKLTEMSWSRWGEND